jgi:levanase
MDSLKNTAATYTAPAQDIQPGTVNLPVTGDVVQIDAEFSPGTSSSFGLKVLGNGTEATRIGYTPSTRRAFIDRTNSGNEGFHPAFASVDDAPVQLTNGRLRVRVTLTGIRGSLCPDGLATLTDQVFPLSNTISLFAKEVRPAEMPQSPAEQPCGDARHQRLAKAPFPFHREERGLSLVSGYPSVNWRRLRETFA